MPKYHHMINTTLHGHPQHATQLLSYSNLQLATNHKY